jgi:uncharacterized protein YacL (UPF0231 family)
MQRRFTLILILFFAGLATTFAQSSSSPIVASSSIEISTDKDLLDLDDNNWSLYADEENKLYYIDFESLSMNLSDIVVKRDNGEVILREDVFELPVDTIYEIDFNQYGSGTYKIELRSFTRELSRTVTVK